MNLNEQEKGILTGIILTVIAFYTFNFFLSSEPSKQQEKVEHTRADKLLNEPLGLYTGLGNKEDPRSRNRNKRAARKKNKAQNKNAATETKNNKEHATKDENKKENEEEEKTKEDNENTDIETDNSYLAKEQYNNESPNSSGIAGVSGSLYTGHLPGENNTTEEFATIEEWIAYFVSAHSLASIDKFTNAYLSQQISSDLFYTVIEELLTNFREKLKQYGIIALMKTPSFESFDHLVHITDSDHHEGVQLRIIDAFNTYTQPGHLSIIEAALNSPKDDVRLKAIKIAVDSAQSNLRPNDNPVAESRQRQGASAQRNDVHLDGNIFLYRRLKVKLENIAQQDHNSTVRSQAEQAVSIINNLLGQFN